MNFTSFIIMLLNKRKKSSSKELTKNDKKKIEELNEMDFFSAIKHAKK